VAGAVVGGATRCSSYVIITKIRGEEVSVVELVLEAVSGVIEGEMAGYMGAKAVMAKQIPKNTGTEKKIKLSDDVEIRVK